MQKILSFFDNRDVINQSNIRLFIIIFIAAILAKGPVIFHGSAIDDYAFISSIDLQVYFSQGRYIAAAIVWFVNSIGAYISDMYFSLGLVTLLLQAVFIMSILRFVGMGNSAAAGIIGAIMIAHPYLTEIYTFRMALPAYSAALFFSILALELITLRPKSWGARAFSLLFTLAMLLTYQVFLNYFAVAVIFAFICGQIIHHNSGQSSAANIILRERALTLAIISTVSAIAFILVTSLTKALGLTHGTTRSSFIALDEIPERIEQMASSLAQIYWSAEPVFSGWLKSLVALMLIISVVIIFLHLLNKRSAINSIRNIFLIVFAFLLLVPVSLGVIMPFGDWWPVPRVIAHVSIIIGLIYLLADSCIMDSGNRLLTSAIFVSRIVILIGFIFLSNQILADQQKVNQWDRMMANRIISRLEMQPNFNQVQFVYINGGKWAFPAKLVTVQGDMNISAFLPEYSKVPLLSAVSGYKFERAIGEKAVVGKTYCKAREPWPHTESVAIDNDLAIICLDK